MKTDQKATKRPVNLVIEGRATIGDREVVHEAVPAEDRMQAFLWRHLVPAEDLKALVYDPSYEPPPKRVPREPKPSEVEKKPPTPAAKSAPKPKFTKRQVAGRLQAAQATCSKTGSSPTASTPARWPSARRSSKGAARLSPFAPRK